LETKRGISRVERKRASIACGVVHEPQLPLLDEPTSRLDSPTAYKVMTLRSLVGKGQNVICTLHQPSNATALNVWRIKTFIAKYHHD
jgi:ABC-type multidrug transport system ATPase subunit